MAVCGLISRRQHPDQISLFPARTTYLRVLAVLGLQADFNAVAADDKVGRKLQDLAPSPAARRQRRASVQSTGPDQEFQSLHTRDFAQRVMLGFIVLDQIAHDVAPPLRGMPYF